MTHPFFRYRNVFGAILNGTIAFDERVGISVQDKELGTTYNVGVLSLYQLDERCEVGESVERKNIATDELHIDIAFASTKSIDVMIKALTILKEKMNNYETTED